MLDNKPSIGLHFLRGSPGWSNRLRKCRGAEVSGLTVESEKKCWNCVWFKKLDSADRDLHAVEESMDMIIDGLKGRAKR